MAVQGGLVDIAAVLAQEELLEPEVLALASVQQLHALGIPLGAALQLHRCFGGAEDEPRGSGGGSSWHTLRVTGSRPLLVDAHTATHLNASTAVVVEDGGVIHVAAGASLFILGSFSAPLQHVFVGEGQVFLKGDSAGRLYPQWWGAVADGSADADWAIQRAVDAATVPLFYNGTGPLCRHCAADVGTNGVTGTVFLPPGVYSVSGNTGIVMACAFAPPTTTTTARTYHHHPFSLSLFAGGHNGVLHLSDRSPSPSSCPTPPSWRAPGPSSRN